MFDTFCYSITPSSPPDGAFAIGRAPSAADEKGSGGGRAGGGVGGEKKMEDDNKRDRRESALYNGSEPRSRSIREIEKLMRKEKKKSQQNLHITQ